MSILSTVEAPVGKVRLTKIFEASLRDALPIPMGQGPETATARGRARRASSNGGSSGRSSSRSSRGCGGGSGSRHGEAAARQRCGGGGGVNVRNEKRSQKSAKGGKERRGPAATQKEVYIYPLDTDNGCGLIAS